MRLDLFLALSFMREGWKQSLLLVLATAVGVTVLFFITALITAVERTMIAQTLGIVPDIIVRQPELVVRPVHHGRAEVLVEDISPPPQPIRSIQNWQAVARYLESFTDVTAVAPTVEGPGFAVAGAATRAVALKGLDPVAVGRVIEIEGKLRSGSLDLSGESALIGTGLAEDLGLTIGDRFRVSTGGPDYQTLRVAGVLDLGNQAANDRWVLLALRRAQALLDLPGGISMFNLRIRNLWEAEPVARILEFETGLDAEPWTESNTQLEVAIGSQRGATLLIRVFVMFAVAMGVASVMIVSTLQKARQIGILRAVGGGRGLVLRAFLLQGLVIAIAGGVLGTGAGTLLSIASMAGSTNPDGTPTYPIELPVSLYLLAFTVAIGTGTAAALFPARSAARLDPAAAIRHD